MRIYGGDGHGWLSRRSLSRRGWARLWYRINEKLEANCLPADDDWYEIPPHPAVQKRAGALRSAPRYAIKSYLIAEIKFFSSITFSTFPSTYSASVVTAFLCGRCRTGASTIKHIDTPMPLSWFSHSAPRLHPVERSSVSSFSGGDSFIVGYRRVTIVTAVGVSLFKPAGLRQPDISRSLFHAKEPRSRFIASFDSLASAA